MLSIKNQKELKWVVGFIINCDEKPQFVIHSVYK